MFRKNQQSSIFGQGLIFDKWLNNKQCSLCYQRTMGTSWCEKCLADLPWWNQNDPIRIPFVDNTTVSFKYTYPLDRLIQAAKYKNNYALITALASLLPDLPNSVHSQIIYPIPVSPWRLLRRGFNQTAVLIGEKISDKKMLVDEVSIHKRSFLPDQSSLDALNRKANATKLFYAKSFAAAEHAVIIDDVITTGATVSAVAKILRNNGAKRVDVCALAAVR